MKRIVIASLGAILVTTVAFAYEIHHPNLRDAYASAGDAIHHIQAAQHANTGVEFNGHAEKAIAALEEAQKELVEGDKWNDAHHKR